MLVIVLCILTFLCIWIIAYPFLLATPEVADRNSLEELRYTEREDLLKFLESLEFEKARGLISVDEYAKQQSKVQKRLQKMSGEDA